jgi:hypothetical protein
VFSITSRYQGIPTAPFTLPDGRVVSYVRRRFVPQPEALTQIGEHLVLPGERIDLIAAREYGDAEQSWRLADGNRAMDFGEVAVPGRRLRVTLAAGLSPIGVIGATGGPAHG